MVLLWSPDAASAGSSRGGGPSAVEGPCWTQHFGEGLEPDSKAYVLASAPDGELDGGEGNEGLQGAGKVLEVLGEGGVSLPRKNAGRLRKTTIVALARKLLVALWKYVTTGVVIEGATMKAA